LYKHPYLDPWCVFTVELRAVLSGWAAEHTARFVFNDGEQEGMTAYQYILGQVPDKIPERAIYRIMSLETTRTSLGLCDNLLSAIEETGAISDGRIRIHPNPQWGKPKWEAWYRKELDEAPQEM